MKNGAEQHERSSRGEKGRADILATAIEVLSELGPDAATLRLVARRSGVNIATLMYYFPSKESLVAEVMQTLEGGELHIVEKWRDSLTDQQLSGLDTLKGALAELGIMIIDRVIEDPNRFRLGVYTALETPKVIDPEGVESQTAQKQRSPEGQGSSKKSSHTGSPEKDVVRSVLPRAIKLGAFRCEMQELDDYIEGYTYLSRGFAIAHIQEIALGSENRGKIIRRFRKFVHRYVNNMLPGE